MTSRTSRLLASSAATWLLLAVGVVAAPATSPDLEERVKKLENLNAQLINRINELEAGKGAAKPGATTTKSGGASPKGASTATGGKKAGNPRVQEASDDANIARDQLTSDGPSLKERSRFFATPESPAASVLGVSSNQIIHADTPKQLIGTALNGIDERGHFQSGLAIDFAPAQLFNTKRLAMNRPAEERAGLLSLNQDALLTYARTVLDRTQLSFATVRGTEAADKSLKFALGIHSVFLDADDPTVRRAAEAGDGLPHDSASFAAQQAGEEVTTGWLKDLNKRFAYDQDQVFTKSTWLTPIEKTLYEHASWSVGAAPVWISMDGSGDSFDYNGTTAWSTFTFSGDRQRKIPIRYLVHFRYRDSEMVPGEESLAPAAKGAMATATSKFVQQDSLLAVVGLRVGTSDLNATATAAYLKAWQASLSDDAFRYTVEAEMRISDNSYLTLSAGREMGHAERKDETLVLGGVRIGLGGTDFTREDRARKLVKSGGSAAE